MIFEYFADNIILQIHFGKPGEDHTAFTKYSSSDCSYKCIWAVYKMIPVTVALFLFECQCQFPKTMYSVRSKNFQMQYNKVLVFLYSISNILKNNLNINAMRLNFPKYIYSVSSKSVQIQYNKESVFLYRVSSILKNYLYINARRLM